jgi:3-phenylpropionate/trans-cinnamate dioxygenase ferredoxin subunit
MPHVNFSIADLAENVPVKIEHEGMRLVLIRSAAGVFAYEDVCPHASWPLSDGTAENGILECPGHGWEFSVETGRSLNAPAYCLTPISVSVQGETILLSWEEKKLTAIR